eukprot:1021442-Pelagomonas_calceolata.AAC.1
MLFILDIIISLTMVTVWGRPVIPSSCLIAKGVNTESKPSHAANDIMGEFSASTVIDALQCFKKGYHRYSLVGAHVNMRCQLHSIAQSSVNSFLETVWGECRETA